MSEAIREIVSDARHSPTVENCQEWRFDWDGRVLAVTSDEVRGNYFHNYGNAARLISLGFLLSHIEVAAADRGLQSKLVDQRLADTGPVKVELEFSARPNVGDPLRAALKDRYVDRRAYAPSILEPDFRAELERCAAQVPNTSALVLDAAPKPLAELLRAVELAFADDRGSRQRLTEWTRMSRREADRTGDGIYWRAWDLPLIALLSMKYDWLFELGRRFGAMRATAKVIDLKIESGHFILFSTHVGAAHRDNLERLVDLGRVVMRSWLTLVSRGYVAQPYSLSVLLRYFLERDMLPPPVAERFRPVLAGCPRVMLSAAPIPDGETPLFLLRFGKPPTHYSPANRTRRLALHRIFQARDVS